MKKLLSLALAALLALTLLPQAAQAKETLKLGKAEEFRFPTDGTLPTAFTVTNPNDFDVNVKVTVYDQEKRQTILTMTFALLKGDAPYQVQAEVYRHLEKDGEIAAYRYTVTTDGGYRGNVYVAQKLTHEKDSNGVLQPVYHQYRNAHYPNNTVSSFGPHFRDVTPELTDLWYMFTPVNLAVQGRQTFPLVASNLFEVGEVYVDVNQDTVTVSYHLFYRDRTGFTTEPVSEFLTFYNSYADVGIVEPEDMPNPSIFAFNQPFSILNHLGGDTNVLMFVRNRLTYFRFPTPKVEYTRFWENKPEYKSWREQLLLLMDPIMTVDK